MLAFFRVCMKAREMITCWSTNQAKQMSKFKRKLNLEARSGLFKMTNKIALTSSVIAVDLIPLLSHGAQGESDEALGRAQGIWWQAGTNIKLTLRCCCSQQKSLVVADFECMFRVKMHQKELTETLRKPRWRMSYLRLKGKSLIHHQEKIPL